MRSELNYPNLSTVLTLKALESALFLFFFFWRWTVGTGSGYGRILDFLKTL